MLSQLSFATFGQLKIPVQNIQIALTYTVHKFAIAV